MTKNGKWSLELCERAHGRCEAKHHDPRCTGVGHHGHHMYYKSHIPKFCYWIIENGIWLSNVCHTLAHRSHNGNIQSDRIIIAGKVLNAAISKREPNKPELRVPEYTEAA